MNPKDPLYSLDANYGIVWQTCEICPTSNELRIDEFLETFHSPFIWETDRNQPISNMNGEG